MITARDIRRLKARLSKPGIPLWIEWWDIQSAPTETWDEDVPVETAHCPHYAVLAEPFDGRDLKLCGVHDGDSFLKFAVPIGCFTMIQIVPDRETYETVLG